MYTILKRQAYLPGMGFYYRFFKKVLKNIFFILSMLVKGIWNIFFVPPKLRRQIEPGVYEKIERPHHPLPRY